MQLKLVEDRIEQMQMVEKAIKDTTKALTENQNIDWSQMLDLIHLTNDETSIKAQYKNATNISRRIIFTQPILSQTNNLGLTGYTRTTI